MKEFPVWFASGEHIKQGFSSPGLSWIPSGYLLTPCFLGRVEVFHFSSAVQEVAAACFQVSGHLKSLQKNIVEEFWGNALMLGKPEMTDSCNGALFPSLSVEE